MERIMKRVPLDFDYPLGKVWYGYLLIPETCLGDCESCRIFGREKHLPAKASGCPIYGSLLKDFFKTLQPPEGEGYQLWETTTEGSPMSPVFKTLNELCRWCSENVTIIADMKGTQAEWKAILEQNQGEFFEGD